LNRIGNRRAAGPERGGVHTRLRDSTIGSGKAPKPLSPAKKSEAEIFLPQIFLLVYVTKDSCEKGRTGSGIARPPIDEFPNTGVN
jgi:hypothetical protein